MDDGLAITHTVLSWRTIADAILRGHTYFATGSQERNANELAYYIDDMVSGLPDEDDVTDVFCCWEAALTIQQTYALLGPVG